MANRFVWDSGSYIHCMEITLYSGYFPEAGLGATSGGGMCPQSKRSFQAQLAVNSVNQRVSGLSFPRQDSPSYRIGRQNAL
jgi:hypothetical protein